MKQNLVTKSKKLPKGWIWAKLGIISKNHDGKRIPVSREKREFMKGKYPYYGASGIIDYVNKPIFNGNFLLIGEDGANLLSRSTPLSFVVKGEFWANNHVHVLSTYGNIPLAFLSNYLNSISLAKWISGSAQPKLNQRNLNDIPVPVPPINEQKQIVNKIEEFFLKTNSTKKSLEKTKLQLKQFQQSFFKSMFEGKQTEKWQLEKLGNPDVCELVGGGTPSRKIPEYFNGNIIWLTPTEIPKNKIIIINDSKEKITKLGLKKSSAKIIPKNSVLLTSRASIGFVAIAGSEVTTNQGFTSFVCGKILHNYFLAYWLFANKNVLESKATGTTFKEISKTKLRELNIRIPSLNEQKQIVNKIDEYRLLIANTENMTNTMLSQLETLHSSILKQAFEGKLVPQDPNDEPASVLLERINKEKTQ